MRGLKGKNRHWSTVIGSDLAERAVDPDMMPGTAESQETGTAESQETGWRK